MFYLPDFLFSQKPCKASKNPFLYFTQCEVTLTAVPSADQHRPLSFTQWPVAADRLKSLEYGLQYYVSIITGDFHN